MRDCIGRFDPDRLSSFDETGRYPPKGRYGEPDVKKCMFDKGWSKEESPLPNIF